MKLTSPTTRPELKNLNKNIGQKSIHEKNNHSKAHTSKTKSTKKNILTRTSVKIDKKPLRLKSSPYFSNVGQSFLRRFYVAGGWVQQGFEKVFTLTFFPKSGKDLKNSNILSKENKTVSKLKTRKYKRSETKKILNTRTKNKESKPKLAMKDPKIFSKKA